MPAGTLGTRVHSEREAAGLTSALRAALGRGPTGTRGRELRSFELAPVLVGLAFLPLLFVLYRRNMPGSAPARR